MTNGLMPTITKPTRITPNCATLNDNIYVMVSQMNNVLSNILYSDISDHLPLLTCIGNDKTKTKTSPPLRFKYRQLNEQSIRLIRHELSEYNWDQLKHYGVNEVYDLLMKKLCSTLERHAPEKTKIISNKNVIKEPWLTRGIMKCNKRRDQLYKAQLGKPSTDKAHNEYITYRNMLNKIK